MASKAGIWNMAVGQLLGTSDIQSTTTIDTSEKHYCNKFYDTCRKQLLEVHDWRFANKILTLSLLSGTPPVNWGYQYAYPTDCVQIRQVVVPKLVQRPILAGEGFYPESESLFYKPYPVPYEVMLTENDDGRRILTDQKDAQLQYTAFIDNEAIYPESFAWAVSWKLAQAIALPLTGNPELTDYAQRKQLESMTQAMASDSYSQHIDPHVDADWTRTRI